MNDWNMWLSSNETRTAIKILTDTTEELRDSITDGSHIQEKDTGKIALDYTYSLGQLAGLRLGIEMLKDISLIVEEQSYSKEIDSDRSE